MSIQERLLKYLDYNNITPYKFSKDLGFSMGYLDKRGAIGTDKYLKIIKHYSDINPEWLLTGEGSMLKQNEKSVNQSIVGGNINGSQVVGNNSFINSQSASKEIKELKKQLAEKDTLINKLIEQQTTFLSLISGNIGTASKAFGDALQPIKSFGESVRLDAGATPAT